ncbi:uncharacterized protein LOC143848797 [Tasmannia lanceolata]|uniref:uncharacterized protein LOC143848797 n=1 Tax=Tasmannia lanceolata TaxID=3420 RepID=UPI0040643320
MSIIRSLAFYNHHGPHLPSRSHARNRNPSQRLEISTLKHGCWLLVNQGVKLAQVRRGELSKIYGMVGSNLPPSNFPKPNLPNWLRDIVITVISITLPFWKQDVEEFLKIEEEVENTAEVVEEVAEAMEKASTDVAEKSDGPVKDAALFVERVSKELDKGSEETLEILHKFDELKKDVEELVEPFTNQEDHKMKKEVEIDQEQNEKKLNTEKLSEPENEKKLNTEKLSEPVIDGGNEKKV